MYSFLSHWGRQTVNKNSGEAGPAFTIMQLHTVNRLLTLKVFKTNSIKKKSIAKGTISKISFKSAWTSKQENGFSEAWQDKDLEKQKMNGIVMVLIFCRPGFKINEDKTRKVYVKFICLAQTLEDKR